MERTPQVKSEILAAMDLLRSPEGELRSLSASSAGVHAASTDSDPKAGKSLLLDLSP